MASELDIVFQGTGTLYAVIRKESDGTVWNGSSFETWVDGSVATYDIALTSQGGDYYAADFPSSITAGQYRVFYYEQIGASPATTDPLLDNESLYWNGSTVSSSPSSDYLTTLARVKVHMGISASTWDSLLTNLLAAASRYIEKYTDTNWLSASYTEYHDGTGLGYLCLNNKFVTAMTRIATDPETVLEIQNTSSSVQRSHVSVTSTGLSLVHTASAASATNTLAFSTYTTISSLVTAVDALGSGWDAAAVSGFEDFPTADLRVIQHVGCSQFDGNTAELEAYVDELYYNRIDTDNGTVWGNFPRGIRNIEAKYTAGYTAGAVPDDVQEACCMTVAALYKMAQTGDGGGLKREKLDQYEYEKFEPAKLGAAGSLAAICPTAALMLSSYRRIHAL